MSITIESLREMLKEKEKLKKSAEAAYMQILGQVQLIEDLIKKEEASSKEKS